MLVDVAADDDCNGALQVLHDAATVLWMLLRMIIAMVYCRYCMMQQQCSLQDCAACSW